MKNRNITSNIISKIALLSLLLFFFGMTTTFAQSERGKQMRNENATPEGKAEKKSQKWKTEFNLSNTQTAQIKRALLKRIKAHNALKGQGKNPQKKEERKASSIEFNREVKRIFTPTQYAAYQKYKDEKKDKKKYKGKKKGKGKHKHKEKNDDDDDDDDF
jgi:hypothetical protein